MTNTVFAALWLTAFLSMSAAGPAEARAPETTASFGDVCPCSAIRGRSYAHEVRRE